MKQLVPFFYKWKKSSRYIPIYSQHCLEYRQSKSFKKSRAQKTEEPLGSLFDDPETLTKQSQPLHACDQEMDSDSDSSVSSLSAISELESSLNSSPDQECAVCGSSSTDRWRRRTTARHEQLIVCSDCHIYWLKYASSRPDADMLKKKYRDERMSSLQLCSRNRRLPLIYVF